jgi:PAS domain S-box-containing protein
MPSPWVAVEAGTDLLARARQIQRNWDRLLGEGGLAPELPPEATAGLRPRILESWRRTLATGLDPTDLLAPIEADEPEVRERWLEHPLGSAAHVLASQLRAVAEETRSLVVVTDASGLLLHVDGADWLKDRAREMNLLEGARYSETTDGTNGIGTALAAEHALQVFAFEHFNQRHHEWICSGAPVHDPLSGRIVGLIDLSSLWKIAHPRSLELVTTAAKTVDRFLSDIQRDRDARLRRRYSYLMTRSTDLLVNRSGYVLDGDVPTRAKPLDVPESGGEIAMDDGSLAVAEPLGQGEAYLVRRVASRRAGAAQHEALVRAEGRGRGPARKRAAPSRARDPVCAGEVESGLPGPRAGEHLSAYLDAAIDCVIVADASGQIVEFNPAAERTFGYSREEALGRTMAELIVPPSLRERHTAAFARFVKTREGSLLGRRVELTGMRADGSEFPVELALSQVEAEPVLICGALRDISGAKQAENHLRELAEEQAALRQVATLVAYESSPDRLVAVVAEQAARVFDVPLVRLIRYEPTAAVVVGGFSEGDDEPFPIGSRWPLDTPGLLATIRQTGRAARVEDYAQRPGDGAAAVRAAGMRSAVGTPIVVGGRVWGAIVLLSPRLGSLPEDAGARLADFTDLVATALANAESRAALSELAAEQAALRRVATHVAREASPVELLVTVAQEVARVLDVEAVGILRFEPDETATLVAQSDTPWDPPPLGTRFTLEGENVVTAVFRTREAARLDDWAKATGPVAEMARVLGIRSSVATPIVVEGRLWGTLIAVTSQSEPIPRETDSRIGEFTELVATAIANAGARDELSTLVEEQAALRRVATLVARGVSPEEIFSAVTNEMAQLFGSPQACVGRFEPDGSAMVVVGVSDGIRGISIGSRWALEDYMASTGVYRTGHPVRVERSDLEHVSGPMADVLREIGVVSNVGAPIFVEGKRWGFVTVTDVNKRLPADAEKRLEKFAELVATAIANAESRSELATSEARARKLADEHAALRRVATLVAEGAKSEAVFSAVAHEVAHVFGVQHVTVCRYEPDTTLVLSSFEAPEPGAAPPPFPAGRRLPLDVPSLPASIYHTGEPVRIDEFTASRGLYAVARQAGLTAAVGVPIVVDGTVWGAINIASTKNERFPPDAEERLARFTELVATSVSNATMRGELAASEARARKLAEEQASLRRVATLVAEGPAPTEVFDAVIAEVGRLLGAAQIGLARYENEHEISVLAIRGQSNEILRAGVRLPLDGDSVNARILRTGRSARINFAEQGSGCIAEVLRRDDVNATVGAPIVVNGAVWGMIGASWRGNDQPPADAEERLAQFAELLATAVSNAVMRTELAASRARVIAAADESRRRIERDLHDGAQQQLVTLAVALQRAQARIPSTLEDVRADVGRVADGLTGAVNELRDLSRGIHPAILTEGGLSPALKALGRRSEVRVKLEIGFEHRLPDQVEVAAYYTVSETLTNASKHANATRAWVCLRVEDDTLLLSVRDDGVGGADASRGSGLTGLRDRIEALGGTIQIESQTGRGTLIEVEIPIAGPAE